MYLLKSVPTDSKKFRLPPNSHVQVLKLYMVEAAFLWCRIVIHKSLINLKCMLAFFKKLLLPAFLLLLVLTTPPIFTFPAGSRMLIA